MNDMRIVRLEAENVKRLRAVEIVPDGDVVMITGRNGAGKTSVLDAMWWALAGTRNHQAKPIREGEAEARITLDLGEIIVRRKFVEQRDGRVTTSLRVESADGSKWASPQQMLDKLVGSLTFDPLEFTRMKPDAQYDALRNLVGIDTSKDEAAIKSSYELRTNANRQAKERAAAAKQIVVPPGTPSSRVDVQALVTELGKGDEHNAKIRDTERERAAERTEIEKERQAVAFIRTHVQDLRDKADAAEREAAERERTAEQRAGALEKLEQNEPLPARFDPEPVRAEIASAQSVNQAIEARERRDVLVAEARAAERKADELSAVIKAAEKRIRKAVERADMPVEGLGFGTGIVTFNDLPLDQASDAEQLRVSCAVAMRSKAPLRVIRVRDGSLLDEQSLAVVAAMAAERKCQVWIEMVDTSGKIGIVIEDGSVVAENPQPGLDL